MRRHLCRLFGHHRDAKRARRSIDGWRSTCIFCSAPLIRISPGDWHPHPYRAAPPTTDQMDFLALLDQ